MGKRRVYELAEERGLTSGELLERLERAGIRDKKPLSSLDESVVEAALSQTATEEGSSKAAPADEPKQKAAASGTAPAKKPAKQAARPKPAKPTARPKAARPAAKPATDKAVGMERLRLRRRVRQLRRVHDAQLKEVAGLAVELHRLDSPKHDELAAERLRAAASTDKELMALERQLSPDEVGGKCPNCGLYSRRTRFCLRCGEKLPGGHTFQPLSLPMALLAVVAIAGAWLLGGVNFGTQSGPDHNSAGATRAEMRAAALRRQQAARSKYRYLVATVKGSKIGVFSSPGAGKPKTTLRNPNTDGAPLVFLVRSSTPGWAHVLLPTRPNGSTGWVRLARVSLSGHSYRLAINLTNHKLTAWKGKKLVLRTDVGVGRAVTPTPPGLYYITELLKQPDPTGTYGPYAFGLSAHSNVLNEFAGADGILGIHGTNFPQGIGTDVSHGCIRMSNKAIVKLAKTLPVGTPVRIIGRRA